MTCSVFLSKKKKKEQKCRMSPDNSQALYKGSFFTHVNNQSSMLE